MREPLIRDYLRLLNEEARAGRQAATALLAAPPDTWPTLLSERPDWVRFGTFDCLLETARDDFYRAPRRALAIAQLVIAYIDAVPRLFPDDFLLVQLRGLAWKELAGAHFALKEYEQAEEPALTAVNTFAEVPALAVDRANALFMQAQIWHELGRTEDALAALDDAIKVYAEYGDAQHYLYAVEFLGIIEFDREHYETARDLFTTAIAEAQRIHDPAAEARSLNNRGQCQVYLGAFLPAIEDLGRAFTAFSTLGMHAAVPESIWGMANMARRRGALREARGALEGVYASFLRLGMVARAMTVLVELGVIVAELEGDVPRARLLCGNFARAIGPYPVDESLRTAVDYLARAVDGVATTEEFATAVAPIRSFCGSSSAVFVSPDSMTA
jgi:tetratricopeptide (TPR) repeat protein